MPENVSFSSGIRTQTILTLPLHNLLPRTLYVRCPTGTQTELGIGFKAVQMHPDTTVTQSLLLPRSLTSPSFSLLKPHKAFGFESGPSFHYVGFHIQLARLGSKHLSPSRLVSLPSCSHIPNLHSSPNILHHKTASPHIHSTLPILLLSPKYYILPAQQGATCLLSILGSERQEEFKVRLGYKARSKAR